MRLHLLNMCLGTYAILLHSHKTKGSHMIKKKGSKYVVTSESGRVLGTHDTREAAQRQLTAIEISKANKRKKRGK